MSYLAYQDYAVQRAIDEIFNMHGDNVSVVGKAKSLIKFGQNTDLGTTEETVWGTGGVETHVATNVINTMVSTAVGDTQDVVIEGHTISGSDLTFVVQTVTLTGTTNVALTTALFRVTRMYNNNSTDFAGTVTIFEDGVNTHLTAVTANDQSLKCATSLSSVDYWIITAWSYGVDKTQTRNCEFKLQFREFGKVYRTRDYGVASSESGMIHRPLSPCLFARPNSDIRVNAISSGAATSVVASIHGYLAIIV